MKEHINWKKLTSEAGLPEGNLGRIGLAIAPSNPKIIYALIEAKTLVEDNRPFSMTNYGIYSSGKITVDGFDKSGKFIKYQSKYLVILLGLWVKYGTRIDEKEEQLYFDC